MNDFENPCGCAVYTWVVRKLCSQKVISAEVSTTKAVSSSSRKHFIFHSTNRILFRAHWTLAIYELVPLTLEFGPAHVSNTIPNAVPNKCAFSHRKVDGLVAMGDGYHIMWDNLWPLRGIITPKDNKHVRDMAPEWLRICAVRICNRL